MSGRTSGRAASAGRPSTTRLHPSTLGRQTPRQSAARRSPACCGPPSHAPPPRQDAERHAAGRMLHPPARPRATIAVTLLLPAAAAPPTQLKTGVTAPMGAHHHHGDVVAGRARVQHAPLVHQRLLQQPLGDLEGCISYRGGRRLCEAWGRRRRRRQRRRTLSSSGAESAAALAAVPTSSEAAHQLQALLQAPHPASRHAAPRAPQPSGAARKRCQQGCREAHQLRVLLQAPHLAPRVRQHRRLGRVVVPAGGRRGGAGGGRLGCEACAGQAKADHRSRLGRVVVPAAEQRPVPWHAREV